METKQYTKQELYAFDREIDKYRIVKSFEIGEPKEMRGFLKESEDKYLIDHPEITKVELEEKLRQLWIMLGKKNYAIKKSVEDYQHPPQIPFEEDGFRDL